MDDAALCSHCRKIIIGRIDKKFCDATCRNSFNNKIKRESETQIVEVNRILRKNRKILKQFNPEGRTSIRKEYLEKLNFNFKFHTHSFSTGHGFTYKFCYEYGYLEMDDGIKVLIVSEEPHPI